MLWSRDVSNIKCLATFKIIYENISDSSNETLQKTLKDTPSQAAVIIQKWFRGWRVRKQQRRSVVQQLLLQKKEEKKLQLYMSVSEVNKTSKFSFSSFN